MDVAGKWVMKRAALLVIAGLLCSTISAVITWKVVEHHYRVPQNHYVVQGSSMQPTLHDGDEIVIHDSATYKKKQIAVFKTSSDWGTGSSSYLIKRIAGTPGDTVQYDHRTFRVNGEKVYTLPSGYQCQVHGTYTHQLTQDELFVQGDNTANSVDSLREICLKSSHPYVDVDDVTTHGTYTKAG